MTYLEEEHPLVFLITFLLLLLSVLLATISTRSPVSSEEEDEKDPIWKASFMIMGVLSVNIFSTERQNNSNG